MSLCLAAGDPDPQFWHGVNLLGLFRAPGDSSDSRASGSYCEDHFRWLNEWGFNFVRLPMDYRHFLSTNDWSTFNSEGFEKVDQAVRFGRKYGIHVQLCLHRAPGYTVMDWDPEPRLLRTDESAQRAFSGLWKKFAARYKNIPSDELSFNLLNEPAHFTREQYVAVFKSALKAIREVDANRFVMLDGNDTASVPVGEFYAEPYTGQAFRGYVPHAVSHYGAWYIKPQPSREPSWPLSQGDVDNPEDWIWRSPEAECDKFAEAQSLGYPVMIGEFGCYNQISHKTALAWMEHCLKLWNERRLGWALWNLEGPFGILDSGRKDVDYEEFHGHKLDRKMLSLLQKYKEPIGVCTVMPEDDGRALINPNMGWTMQYYSNGPRNYGSKLDASDSMSWFPGCSVCYMRLPWALIEPEEGQFNWIALDTPAQRWIDRGGQIAIRITSSESWMRYATPEWVRLAGAKGVFYDFGWGSHGGIKPDGKNWDPDFVGEVFLAKLENLVRALAERYDGRKEVAFVDIGSYGMWGEGHTDNSSRIPQRKMNQDVRRHIDLYRKYFRKTQLVISDDVSGFHVPEANPELLAYARSQGVGWRDDSIMVDKRHPWWHANQAELFWRDSPVVLEHEHYGASCARGAWRDDLLLKAVEDHHASYMSIHWWPEEFLEKNKSVVDAINRKLGYRFLLKKATWPCVVRIDGEGRSILQVDWQWRNGGVAPCYQDAYPCVTLKSKTGGILAVVVDRDVNLKGRVGLSVAFGRIACTLGLFGMAKMAEGTVDVFVSVGALDGTPIYELPYPDSDGHRRYRIGGIRFVRKGGSVEHKGLAK